MENQSEFKKVRIRLMLLTLLFLGLLFYFFQFNPLQNEGVFLRCPSNLIFGINCPGCGSQRALHYLLHFDFLSALRNNVLFVFAFPFVLYILIVQLINKWNGTKKTIPFITNKNVIIGLLIVIVLFGIIRNIPSYPFTLLSP